MNKFEIDSEFSNVFYEIKDRHLIIKTKNDGVLAIACENVPKFCEELRYIAKTYRNAKIF